AATLIAAGAAPALGADNGIHKIKHVVVIMQENRSFDSYFGTYPGADGIPMHDGQPAVCVPDPKAGSCQRPYHDSNLVNHGGPHTHADSVTDVDGGKMDGFVTAEENGCPEADNETVDCSTTDVMGYHDGREIPNYWSYARNFVLQDHMFQPSTSWSLPAHLFAVSEWSAKCSRRGDPMSFVNAIQSPQVPPAGPSSDGTRPNYAW